MFIYFLTLSPACYMHPMCRWEGFSDVTLRPSIRFCILMHIFVLYCS